MWFKVRKKERCLLWVDCDDLSTAIRPFCTAPLAFEEFFVF